MNFFKRAWLSMKARKGRSVLQLIIFTVVCVLILSGFTIQSAADKASELAREQLGGTVTLTVDREKQMQTMREEASSSDSSSTESKPQFQSSPIDVSDANDLAKLNHVASYNYYSSTQALASGFDPIESSGDTSSSNDESSTTAETQGPGGGQGGPQMVDADLSISGLLDSATSTDFEAGTSELTSGVAITSADKDKNVAMVEENLAEENDWKVGDSFTVTSSDGNTKVTLKIVGIYKTTDSGSDMAQNFSFLNPYNKVYVPYTVANTIKGSDYKNTVDSAVYTMDDAANISAFEKEAKKVDSIDWDTFKLDANDTLYQQMIGPINSVASFSKNVVYIVSIAGALILGLLVMMQVRDRKYEMGVLLAIGEKRGKLIAQFFVEILIVALVSFGLAAASSHYVAQLAGNQLLAQQNSSTNETTTSTENRGPGGGGGQGGPGGFGQSVSNLTKNTEQIKELDIQVTLEDMLKMGGIGIGIAFISVLLPAALVLRMNPKTILTKQE
ncbi:ABC transporter permease [Listeria monocytogenes]|jgi:ABC-type antimicrobial peptide transport system, permease component|uniref:Lmo1506 protein n=2 Tax=Listeria monocytogenes TaxID=1639 RepID=Q8Y720_LISMO|nr:ABC transporter permease [Listeria monocytogenes]NP_465031.1 transporter [Listeria monocytogenes EGD-e]EAD5037246.1 ABC transporter permease [Listeria monocytogenes serotype 1/2a]EAF4573626.1 ABC transporter permease [Listeria monocytogenes serotype 4b]ANE39393.1 macrolide ABC transporter permease [Listeria monocytogenes]EAA0254724.1 ABC transporter permease [Listeria monocytogenes]EAC2272091.1 ABC transporter permease [Listeria monocytogenes]